MSKLRQLARLARQDECSGCRTVIASMGRPAQQIYDYANPVDLKEAGAEPLFVELVTTAAFKRLQDVRFLGGIDYILIRSPNGSKSNTRYTRYQHSLGVARLAALYADAKRLSDHDRRLAYAAALLHDIGHAPLSHSLEPVFEEIFGLNHHSATEAIVMGHVEFGREVHQALRKYGIDPAELLAVIEGKIDPFQGFFAGPINFDTIEGILRSRRYVKPDMATPNPTDVVSAAIRRQTSADCQLVDAFWAYKDEIYKIVIKSRYGVLADYLCQYVVKNCSKKLTASDFFSTERALFRKIPELRHILTDQRSNSLTKKIISNPIPYKERRFYVNGNASFFNFDDNNRYKQSKQDRLMTNHVISSNLDKQEEWDLFHDTRMR